MEHSCWSNGNRSIQECLEIEGFSFDATDSCFVKNNVRIPAREIIGNTPATFFDKATRHGWFNAPEPETVESYSWGDQFIVAGMDFTPRVTYAYKNGVCTVTRTKGR